MSTQSIVGIIAIGCALCFGFFAVWYFLTSRRGTNMRGMMTSSAGMREASESAASRERLKNDPTGEEFEKVKEKAKNSTSRKQEVTVDDKLFQAGLFSDEDRRDFYRQRTIIPCVAVPVSLLLCIMTSTSPMMTCIFVFFAGAVGYRWPNIRLDSAIKRRSEDLMYYLPLVIEQIVIGVSSSLDIGPCLQRVVQMADDRDTHNSVSELLKISQFYIRSGITLEEALTEVGRRAGHTEVKHAFMSLAQVSRHGGEVTKQLQELADSVSNQRETRIEAKIKRLELEATAPVAVTFVGFMGIFLSGLAIQLMNAFGGAQ